MKYGVDIKKERVETIGSKQSYTMEQRNTQDEVVIQPTTLALQGEETKWYKEAIENLKKQLDAAQTTIDEKTKG